LRSIILNLVANDLDQRGISIWRVQRQRSTLNAQRSTVRLDELLSVGRWALSVERLPPTLDELIRCVVSETDQHIPQTAAGLSLPAAMVFKAMVLHSRRDSSRWWRFF
jgi:hypothetical protein